MLDNVSDLVFGPVFDTVDIGLVVIDADGRVVGWNDWMGRIARRPAKQVIGTSFYEIFPEAAGTRLPGVIEDSFKVGSSSILTHTLNALLPLQGEGGEPILHNIVVRPVSSVHTNYCLLQITDVTVAVTRERVLRERQNARYHAIVDSAPDAIITIDNDRNIQWVNGAVDHVLGYGHSELLGQKLDILLQPDNPLLPALAESSVDQKTDSAVSVVGRYKNGKFGHFDISLGHWRADQRDFVTTIWRDVTERVAADAALRHRVPGIDGEINQSQFKLVRINLDRADLWRNLHVNDDVWTDGMPQEIQHLGDQPLQGNKFDLQFLPSSKCQQSRGQGSTAFGPLDSSVQQSGYPRFFRNRLLQQAQTAQYDGQQVVEVVRHPARQLPDALHLLGFVQLP